MMKAIFAKHVKEGDVILIPGGKRISVAYTDQRGATVRVGTADGQADFGEYDIIGLGHRPWPEEKTNSDMLQAIAAAVFEVYSLRGYTIGLTATQRTAPEFQRAVDKLREAIQAYELGKSSDMAQSVPSKRQQPEGREGYGVKGVGTVWTPK